MVTHFLFRFLASPVAKVGKQFGRVAFFRFWSDHTSDVTVRGRVRKPLGRVILSKLWLQASPNAKV